MENNKSPGYCKICGGTMSVHINVGKPLNHKFKH